MERTKWSQKVRFGADRGDGAAPLSCEVAWWIHTGQARPQVPPHLKSDTVACFFWPRSLLMLVREKMWFWIASITGLAAPAAASGGVSEATPNHWFTTLVETWKGPSVIWLSGVSLTFDEKRLAYDAHRRGGPLFLRPLSPRRPSYKAATSKGRPFCFLKAISS